MNERTITLTEQQINQVYDYLASKPYREVAQIMRMLDNLWVSQNDKKDEKES